MSSSGSNSPSRDCLDYLTVFGKAALRMSCLPPTGYFSIVSVFVMSPVFSHSIGLVYGSTQFPLLVRNRPGIVAEFLS